MSNAPTTHPADAGVAQAIAWVAASRPASRPLSPLAVAQATIAGRWQGRVAHALGQDGRVAAWDAAARHLVAPGTRDGR